MRAAGVPQRPRLSGYIQQEETIEKTRELERRASALSSFVWDR